MLARTASAMTAAAAQVWPEPAAAPDKGTARALFLHQARGVFEGFVLLVALVAVERIFLGRGTYAGLDVHPFWLPVLLVTMQYGLYGGVITACLASLMLDWPIRPPGQDIVDFYFELVRLPVQWVLVAMAIGIFRQAQIRADAVRERTLAHLRSVNDLFAQEVARLDDELYRFETAVATAGPRDGADAAPTLPEALARLAALRTADAAGLGERFAAAAAAVLRTDAVRLFRAAPDGSYADVSAAPPLPGLAATLPAGHPLLVAARGGPRRPKGAEATAIPLLPAAGRGAGGFIVAVGAPQGVSGVAWDEGLRLLADAAAAGLAHARPVPGIGATGS
ncbi:MAG: hypothetical protein U1E40_12330 [Amaricoccus sp.]